MSAKPVPPDVLAECATLAQSLGVSEAARRMGISRSTMRHRLRIVDRLQEFDKPHGADVGFEPTPPDDIPIDEVIAQQARRFRLRHTAAKARDWPAVSVADDRAIGILWFGDPHLDSDGCNWPLLQEHIALCKSGDGVYGANIGDTTDNWAGRLMRLYAEAETSKKTARRLAKWFLTESGVDWLVWLFGNHDEWNDGAEFLRLYNVNGIRMEEWQARFRLRFSNGRECKIHAAHNFPGSSIWNSLHGPQRAAHTKADAHLYIAGHTHNWALHQEESASRGFTYWLARARGYKYLDAYADNLGHMPQREGAAILTVIDPVATSDAGFVQCFADPAEGVDYLRWKRSR